jgi:NADH dehydrogenase FAD-containing subunit
LRGEPTRPFSFKAIGQLCSIGGHSAVAEFQGVQLSGFLAWLLWRGVYLFKLPAWARRFQVGFDWAWQLLLPFKETFAPFSFTGASQVEDPGKDHSFAHTAVRL